MGTFIVKKLRLKVRVLKQKGLQDSPRRRRVGTRSGQMRGSRVASAHGTNGAIERRVALVTVEQGYELIAETHT